MALFDQIMGALNNPNQQANPDQLGGILSAVQQLSGSGGLDPSTTQTVMSLVGGQVRSALQQKRQTEGASAVESLINQFAGTSPSTAAVSALLPPAQQQQLAQTIAQKTGLEPSMVQGAMAMAVPVVLNLLSTGAAAKPSGQAASPATGGNPVLSAFLDSDGDGDTDLGDALSMAGRFLNK